MCNFLRIYPYAILLQKKFQDQQLERIFVYDEKTFNVAQELNFQPISSIAFFKINKMYL